MDDDAGEQVEPGHAVVLALAGAVADFALASDSERVLERVMSLALVQAGSGRFRPVQAGSGRFRPVQAGSGRFRPVQAGSGRFRPVQAGVGPALHIGVEQPVDDEESSFDPSDFA